MAMPTPPDTVELFDLFPTPVRRVQQLLKAPLIEQLIERFAGHARRRNSVSDALLHTELVTPKDHPSLQEASRLIVPHVVDFGALLLGERLHWLIKEMWVNVLEDGGRQALHNHANSFVSGVLFLSATQAPATTVFARAPGGSDFVFNNTNARSQLGPYNAEKWVSPAAAAGDLLLFPSYLLHEVPTHQGGRRISLAFNAVPSRLDSWGYTLTLSR
jgi:uncharacterized protein (TIGR02466 family)